MLRTGFSLLTTTLFLLSSNGYATSDAPTEETQIIPSSVGEALEAENHLRMVFTGGEMGIGSGRYRFKLPWEIRDFVKANEGQIHDANPIHGCLTQGPYTLIAPNGRAAHLAQFLADGPITCSQESNGISIRTTTEELYVSSDAVNRPWAQELQKKYGTAEPVQVKTCTNTKGEQAQLFAPAFEHFEPESWSINDFEFRLAFRLKVESGDSVLTAHIVGHPSQESARQVHLLKELIEAEEHTIYVDAGSFVDGTSSVRDGQLSLHRPLGFEILKSLNPAALAPGETELIAGPTVFLKEARDSGLPYVATNWESDNADLELPEHHIKEVPGSDASIRIAFLGIVDPAILNWVPSIGLEGVTLTDPIEAITQKVQELKKLSNPPDLIVLLTTAHSKLLRALHRVEGVDLIIGNTKRRFERVRELRYLVRHKDVPRESVIGVFPVDGVNVGHLKFTPRHASWALSEARIVPHLVPANATPEPKVISAISQTRAKVYPELDVDLLPSPTDDPLSSLSHQEWSKLVCESVRTYSDSDIVLLPELPQGEILPGESTELMVVDRLAILDGLEVHHVPGAKIISFLRSLRGIVPLSCGGHVGEVKPKIQGRLVDVDRMYRVVSTDRARVTFLGPYLKSAYSTRLLDPGFEKVTDPLGRQVTLRSAVLKVFRDVKRDIEPEARREAFQNLALPSVEKKRPLWLFRIARLSSTFQTFKGAGNEKYASVPETLVTSPSSQSLGLEADLSLNYSGIDLAWDARLRASFSELEVSGLATEELADDFRISSAFSAPGITFDIPSMTLMPFVEVLLDSEITPVTTAQELLPRQQDLLFELGLAAKKTSLIRAMRLGGFVGTNLNKTTDFIDYGARFELETLKTLKRSLRFSTLVDGWFYGDTPDDSESDLRFKLRADARFSLPLARYLDLSMFFQAFVFQGRLSSMSEIDASYTLGLSLDIRSAFNL